MADQFGSVEEARVHVQRADVRWQATVEAFDPYPERLRRLSEAADQERKALLFAEVCGAPWSPINVGPGYSPAENLEPGHRPGPDRLWTDFDKAVKQLGRALGGDGHATLAIAFGQLSQAAGRVAEELTKLGIVDEAPVDAPARRETG